MDSKRAIQAALEIFSVNSFFLRDFLARYAGRWYLETFSRHPDVLIRSYEQAAKSGRSGDDFRQN